MSLQLVCDGSRAEAVSSLQQQKRKSLFPALTQAATLFSLAPVHAIAGPSLRREYVVALRELAREIAQEARARGHGSSGRRADRQTGDAPPPPCAHCALWPTRPVFGGFSAAVHAMPEVSDADVAAVYREVIARRLAPMRRAGGLRAEVAAIEEGEGAKAALRGAGHRSGWRRAQSHPRNTAMLCWGWKGNLARAVASSRRPLRVLTQPGVCRCRNRQ
jgi:hypothetical protein